MSNNTSPGAIAYFRAFFTSEHIFFYLLSLVVAGSISFGHALLYAKLMVKDGIPVHKGMIPNTICRTFGAYLFAFVLLFIQNTPVGTSVLGTDVMSVGRQLRICLFGQSFGCCIDFACWWALLKLYKRYEKLRGKRMYRTLFGWTKEETEASWEMDEAQDYSNLDVEEGAIKLV